MVAVRIVGRTKNWGSPATYCMLVYPAGDSVICVDDCAQYMRPWYVALGRLGKHGVVLGVSMTNREFLIALLFEVKILSSYASSVSIGRLPPVCVVFLTLGVAFVQLSCMCLTKGKKPVAFITLCTYT